MFELLSQTTDTCPVVRFSGNVTGEEYQMFLDAVSERLKTREKINLVIELRDLDFYGDLDAAQKDMKFGFGEYKHVRRAAFVGDQKWLKWFTKLMSPFTKTEEKQFPESQLAEACNWASA
jgi:hypothetical protein